MPSIFINPRAVPAERRAEVAATLAQILKMDPNGLADLLARPKYFAWVKRKVSQAESEAVLRADLPGIGVRDEPSRCYPNGTLLCHVLGGVGADGNGLAGLEAEHERDARRHGRLGAGVQGRTRPHDVRRAALERAGERSAPTSPRPA